jgi:hypothetical protein
MQQTQEQPLHWDDHRTKINLTFIFALIVAVIGWFGQPQLIFIGVGVAIYSWLTNPKQYLIYRDALVIIYGRPRIKSYPFQEMAHLELLTLPIGDRLRIRMANGRRLMLLTKDSATFMEKLDAALDAFHGGQRGTDYSDEEQPNSQPEIESEIEAEIPPENRLGKSSTENDDVPY